MAEKQKIHFRCPECDKPVSVASQHAGKRGKCPGCGAVLQIPAVKTEDSRTACQACGVRVETFWDVGGHPVCKKCYPQHEPGYWRSRFGLPQPGDAGSPSKVQAPSDAQQITQSFVDNPCDKCGSPNWQKPDGTDVMTKADFAYGAPLRCSRCGRWGVIRIRR